MGDSLVTKISPEFSWYWMNIHLSITGQSVSRLSVTNLLVALISDIYSCSKYL